MKKRAEIKRLRDGILEQIRKAEEVGKSSGSMEGFTNTRLCAGMVSDALTWILEDGKEIFHPYVFKEFTPASKGA